VQGGTGVAPPGVGQARREEVGRRLGRVGSGWSRRRGGAGEAQGGTCEPSTGGGGAEAPTTTGGRTWRMGADGKGVHRAGEWIFGGREVGKGSGK
jgi:hypothetical protein